MLAKIPGTSLRIEPVKMDFHYGTSFGKPSPEAYERLLLDAMSGDPTLFARRDEVEEAWSFIDPIEEVWHAEKDAPELYFYPAGSWGPEAADDLLARDARQWRRL
jgi:glucose-6-phosphate 1-dehydrogenase